MENNENTQQIVKEQSLPLPAVRTTASEYFTLFSASMTNVGCVRKINEDACLEMPEKKIWVVADGMGGHEAGDVASRMVVDHLRNTQYSTLLSKYVDNVEDGILAANRKLCQLGGQVGHLAGTTVVAQIFHQKHCLFLWVGDSRAYLSRNGRGEPVTQDHSYVEELVSRGEITREEAESHPKANVITRAVGAGAALFLDMDIIELQHDDMFLLCSDGLFKEVSELEIYEAMKVFPPDQAVHELMKLALARGARDNVTIICSKVQKNGT